MRKLSRSRKRAYDFISSVIGEYDEIHPKINGIEKIEIKLAASFVLDHFNQYKDKANEELQEANKLLEVLKGGLTGGAADITNLFSTTSYESYSAAMSEDPTQTTVRPYSSMRPGTSYGYDIGPEPYQHPWYYYIPVKTRPV